MNKITQEQMNQYVNHIKTLENALNTIKKETSEQMIFDIAEHALSVNDEE